MINLSPEHVTQEMIDNININRLILLIDKFVNKLILNKTCMNEAEKAIQSYCEMLNNNYKELVIIKITTTNHDTIRIDFYPNNKLCKSSYLEY